MNTKQKAERILMQIGLASHSGAMEDFKDIAEICQAYLDQQWIPVSERLPDLYQRVLTWTVDADDIPTVLIAHWNGDKEGFLGLNGYKDRDVTHWMPLPEPPESE